MPKIYAMSDILGYYDAMVKSFNYIELEPFYLIIFIEDYVDEEAGDRGYLGFVYWDEKSHYYIDGHTTESNVVPVLRYDNETSKYTFLNTSNGDWESYTFR